MNTFIATAGTALALDAIWLTLQNKYHRSLFQSIQHSPLVPRLFPAIGVYLIIPAMIMLGAVNPATSIQNGITRGAIIGFIVYAFYDLTNYATLTNWTLHMTVTDIMWGTLLCAIAAGVGTYVKK